MKFDCGETPGEHFDRMSDWHPFFAVFPRQVASHDCRWLEWIERKGTCYGEVWWDWEYRAK